MTRGTLRHCRSLIVALLSLPALGAAATEMQLPRGWSLVPAGDQMQVRGLLMRLSAGIVTGDLATNLDALKRVWGEPLAVRTEAHGTWVSKPFSRDFVTVQLSLGPGDSTTRVVMSRVNLRESLARPAPAPWSAMPAGSKLRLDTESTDRGQRARQVSYINRLSALANRDHVVQSLTSEGYVLQSDTETPAKAIEGRLLMFARGADETTVVIRFDRGLSNVTVNQRPGLEPMRGYR